MTDTETRRIEEICQAANVKNIGSLSDGFHTFDGLYEQRMYLFAALVKTYKDKSWKSYRHEDGELCFGGGWFIVGIDTPEGSYTYHYKDKYYSMFDCIELGRAKHWDGHTEKDVDRLLSLANKQSGNEPTSNWIPCSERLPNKRGKYLVTVSGVPGRPHTHVEKVYFGDKEGNIFWTGKFGRSNFKNITGIVTAWMPLPEPYREEEK